VLEELNFQKPLLGVKVSENSTISAEHFISVTKENCIEETLILSDKDTKTVAFRNNM
jgi:hypothetical protein